MLRCSAIAACALLGAPALAQDSADALQAAFVAAVGAEDADAVAALYVSDAHSFGTAVDAVGTEAIRADWAGTFAALDDIAITIEQEGALDLGDHAAAWGHWSFTANTAEDGAPVAITGRFLDVSMATPQGWRYVADHASVTPPAPPEAAE
jgi:ketosteroid isomerase-like protein